MIARISRAKSGIGDYLEKGIRKDSQYIRTEKDNVIKNLRKELAQYQRDYANRNSWVEQEEEND